MFIPCTSLLCKPSTASCSTILCHLSFMQHFNPLTVHTWKRVIIYRTKGSFFLMRSWCSNAQVHERRNASMQKSPPFVPVSVTWCQRANLQSFSMKCNRSLVRLLLLFTASSGRRVLSESAHKFKGTHSAHWETFLKPVLTCRESVTSSLTQKANKGIQVMLMHDAHLCTVCQYCFFKC